MQYDSSVRNSESTVVQFVYGDDSLNPEKMENNDRPVDFHRLRVHINQTYPCPDEASLRSKELIDAVEEHLAEARFQRLLPTGRLFLSEIRDFYGSMAKMQDELMSYDDITDEDLDRVTWNSCRITKTQLTLALEKALNKYTAAYVEPGEAVGAMGAQSISEPGTQMTLKVRMLSVVGENVSSVIQAQVLLTILMFFAADVSLCRRILDECDSWCAST